MAQTLPCVPRPRIAGHRQECLCHTVGVIERRFDRQHRPFNKRITIGQKHYLERVTGYDLDEITVMFTSCDLSIRAAFGDFEGAPYRHGSKRLILAGSKGL